MLDLPDREGILVALDTEASGLHVDDGARISVISIAWKTESGKIEARAFPFDQGTSTKFPMQISLFAKNFNLPEEDWDELMIWLSKQKLVMHNAYYDLQILRAGHREWKKGHDFLDNVVWDTMIGSWVLEPKESRSLDANGERHFDLQKVDIKAELARVRKRYDLIEWEIMEPYALQDAILTLRLYYRQQQMVEGKYADLAGEIDWEMRVLRVFVLMAYRGIGYNAKRSRIEAAKAKAKLKALDRSLPFHPPTPAGARKWFFGETGVGALPHCTSPKTGIASVSECCVRSLIAQQAEGAELWSERQKIFHAISAWYEGFADACGSDGRLRSTFNQAGTINMRVSSERINLQAIPQNYRLSALEGIVPPRQLFQPMPGYELWEFDLSQAEARAAARGANAESWLEMFRDGRDLHSETAMRLFGKADSLNRGIAKRANFGLIYGVGPATFQRDIEKHTGTKLLDAEAKEIVMGWRKLYPEFGRANKRASKFAEANGFIRLMDGRIRWFRPYEDMYKAYSAIIQGSIAQFVKDWMVEAEEAGFRVILQVHDSIVLEVREEDVERTEREMMELGSSMATTFFDVPMLTEAKRWETL